jgi:prevent-host-death family protein
MHIVSSTDAKRNLGSLLEEVQSGEIVEIEVFGKPKAVLMSAEQFEEIKPHLKMKRKREFGAWKDILAGVDVNALLATPIEGLEEYMPQDSPEESA